MSATCTWAKCSEPATRPQLDKLGREWARLCAAHDKELDEAVSSLDPKRILRAWILAQGGAKAAARRL